MGHRDLLLEAKSRLEEYLGMQIDRHTDTYLPPDHLRGASKSAERNMHYRKTVDPDLAALIGKIEEATAVSDADDVIKVNETAASGVPAHRRGSVLP